MRVTVAVLAVAVLAVGAPPALGAPDRTPPTKPGKARLVAKTQTSATIAWNASTDNSGSLSYVVHLWQDSRTVTLPKSQTSYTWTGLRPNVQYYLWVEAVDPSNNKSTSDLVTVTTDRDTTPPSAPGNLRVTSVSASQVSLSWDASSDNTGILAYSVLVSPQDGNVTMTGPASATIVGLRASTAYSFAVRATDFGYNSATSGSVSVTTAASTDHTAPSAPGNLYVEDQGCGEVHLSWTQSTDDQDPQSAIRYQLLINGAPDPLGQTPIGTGRWITYGVVDGANAFVLRAVDSAGNVSAAGNTFTLNLNDCQ